MEPTCSSPTTRGDLSAAMTRANNIDWNFSTADYMLSRPADFFVYLFNIAKQEYKVSRLPLIKEMILPARKEGEKYALITKLPSPFKFPKGNVDSNDIDIVVLDGRRMAPGAPWQSFSAMRENPIFGAPSTLPCSTCSRNFGEDVPESWPWAAALRSEERRV